MKGFINYLKIAVLIILAMVFNVLPMILLQKQHDIPMVLNWGIGIFYLVIVGSEKATLFCTTFIKCFLGN
ncbi:CAAX amino terminal protease family protein [Streptococcus pyogenes]|nr:CAAX amino terminal protease family protein [Streptococcus pyogenes]VHF26090.1 CAAX amino terminal protease family protein [Streptococcus pyogenes]VHM56152.1 CAAX amino terminal protease family protein [Streptococcus pyogenes]